MKNSAMKWTAVGCSLNTKHLQDDKLIVVTLFNGMSFKCFVLYFCKGYIINFQSVKINVREFI